MVVDTAKDARVLILEDALRRIDDLVTNRRLRVHIEYRRLEQLVQDANNLLYEIKYSYIEPDQLAELPSTKRLVETVSEIGELVHSAVVSSGYRPKTTKEQLVHAELEYAVRTANGLPRRLHQGISDPGYAVDILAVEVSKVEPVPGATRLFSCRCTDGRRIWKILTNISGIKNGSRHACAALPPVEMMDGVSEAMFLGGEILPEDTPLGVLTSVPSQMLDQARAQVLKIIERLI